MDLGFCDLEKIDIAGVLKAVDCQRSNVFVLNTGLVLKRETENLLIICNKSYICKL
ncbi:MAG: hypothetical protein ACI9WT_000650 [Flavobacterium sp.]|jgi:hypothetical protein